MLVPVRSDSVFHLHDLNELTILASFCRISKMAQFWNLMMSVCKHFLNFKSMHGCFVCLMVSSSREDSLLLDYFMRSEGRAIILKIYGHRERASPHFGLLFFLSNSSDCVLWGLGSHPADLNVRDMLTQRFCFVDGDIP